MIKIKVGEKAPLFILDSYNSGRIDLNSLIGMDNIVLIFSRYFGCPICQLDLADLLEYQNEIEKKGGKILYITQSETEIAKKAITENSITFPVIYSSNKDLYKTYGLGKFTMSALGAIPAKLKASKKAGFSHGKYEGSESQCPGQFIIDKNGIIIHAFKGWLDTSAILDAL